MATASGALSRAQYDRLVADGTLEGAPVELVRGRLVPVSPQGPVHAAVIQAVTVVLAPPLRRLRVQMPLAATEDSAPEPDVALVDHADVDAHPPTADLVVEVVVSARREAWEKVPVYAAAGVGACWVVDVPARCVDVLDGPGPAGYAARRTLRGDDPLVAPPPAAATTVAALFAAAGLGPHQVDGPG